MNVLNSLGRMATRAGDRLLGLWVPGLTARAAYRCGPTYQSGDCYGRGITWAECECRSGVTYRRWCYSCSGGGGGCHNWQRTNLAC